MRNSPQWPRSPPPSKPSNWVPPAAQDFQLARGAAAYARTRYQFGRPIGSFQAVKHKCADMLVRVELAEDRLGI